MNTIVEIIEKIKAEVNRQKSYYYYINNSYNKKAVRVCNNLLSVLGYLEKEERSKNSTDQEQPVKTNIVEDLKHYLSTTPKGQIKKDWESLKEWDKVGPSVSEFLGWKQPICEGLEDILLEFYDEYDSNVENRPIIPRIYAEKLARHFYELGRQSKPKVCEGLEEEIKRWWGEEYMKNSEGLPILSIVQGIARHFAQWGAEHCGSSETPNGLT